jgi:hypothetical protein
LAIIPWWIASIPFENDVLWNEQKGKTGYICKSYRGPLVKKEYFILTKGEIRFGYMSAISIKLQVHIVILYSEVADIHFRDCPCIEPGFLGVSRDN